MINSTINNHRWVMRTITQFLVTGIFLATASHIAAQNQPPDLVILQSDLSRADFSRASSGTPNTSSRPDDLHMPSVTTRSLRGFFIQSTLRIRNTGSRIIYLVNWDYILSDRKNEQEVAHFQFQDKVMLRPNKTDTLWSMIDGPRLRKLNLLHVTLAVMNETTDPTACVSSFPNSHSLLLSSQCSREQEAALEWRSRHSRN